MSFPGERMLRKLLRFSVLGADEIDGLFTPMSAERRLAPREDLIQEHKPADGVFAIEEGVACRYKLLPNGRRQIVGLLLPGDVCDLQFILLKRMDHSICAMSPVRARVIPLESMMELLETFPRLARALWWTNAVDSSISREWMVNAGYRTALERTSHLFCEVYHRLEAVGLVQNSQCELPLTQTDLGDTLALSSVHVNRTLMYMRRNNLVRLQGGLLELLDRRALEAAAGFNAGYLHLEGANAMATPVYEGRNPGV